ncbi:hypothetical protein HK097_010283 [Rhizophlyctis rosea]|uniref:Uncharacterized protein n=1 Tax=Rhizophlyctis rosea TaxID=64517 RepID=A0AAD5SKH6_9FUNG|nr:hypothetical protein HK097_010283 [Rhizophlyctis rosea]
MLSNDEEHIEQRELEASRKELEWLLATEVPRHVEEIGTLLKKALACCGAIPDPGTGSKPVNQATLAITSQNADTVKGHTTINGTSITKGEMIIKFPHYNRGNPFKVTLNPAKPVLLDQAQRARNCLVTAFDLYESRLAEERNKDSVMQLLDRICTIAKQARDSLSKIDPRTVFPNKEPDPKNFTPDLPEDLVIEYHINQTSLVVSIFALNFHHAGLPLDFQSKILSKFKVFKIDTYKGRPVEILDEFTTEATCPTFTALFKSIESVEEVCTILKKKLQIIL